MTRMLSRARRVAGDLRPRGHAWWLIAAACAFGVLLFALLWLGRAGTPTATGDASVDSDRHDRHAVPLPAPLAASGAESGIAYPDPPAAAPALPAPPDPVLPEDIATRAPAPHVVAADTSTTPRPVSSPAPTYPRASIRRNEAGEVLLRVHVGENGRTTSIDVVRSSGHNRLDQAAIKAVRRWRFDPATRGGQAVPGEVQIPVAFSASR